MAKVIMEVDIKEEDFANNLISRYQSSRSPILRVYLHDKTDRDIVNSHLDLIPPFLNEARIGMFRALNKNGETSVVLVPLSLCKAITIKRINTIGL